jgi:hypothetical protein
MSDTRPGPDVTARQPGKLQAFKRNLEMRYREVKHYVSTHKSGRLLAAQIVCALTVLVGIAQYSIPIALIIGGVGGVLAIERQSR